jgi:RNA polymerase sporulation-specific sigma factor
VLRARNGDGRALDALIRRYAGFVRMKASSYFLAGGDAEDLHQEGLIGLYKAIRDYRVDKDTSFRSFAELCITRQIITAIKGATRYKHGPLNGYVSFSHSPAGQDPDAGDCTLGDTLAASSVNDPCSRVISTEGLEALVGVLGTSLSRLESEVLALFIDGESYDEIARRLTCDAKAVDNALQRVKRKVGTHLSAR